jgi:porphobilinogen synthase
LLKRAKMLVRPRRLRKNQVIRNMVAETHLKQEDLIQPLFVKPGKAVKDPIPSMPGIFHFSPDTLAQEAYELWNLGIKAVILFGLPEFKDEVGSSGALQDGVVQRGVKAIKDKVSDMLVITDVCLCEYTSHGHCGVVREGRVLNDPTLEHLVRQALSHARAGADVVAPSDMMDGRVKAIREALEQEGFQDVLIMSYAVKYASGFYGPFREAADSAPQFGDRSTYQMDPRNWREAIKEARLDEEEGADILMVKPAFGYLDVVRAVRENTHLPLAAYNVSGEYSMLKAAAQLGWLDEKRCMMEMLYSIKRAGADLILTYFCKEVSSLLG